MSLHAPQVPGTERRGEVIRVLHHAERALRALEAAGMALAAVAFAAMMFVTVVDVVGRYGFNRPLTWSFDLMTQYLMVGGFFLVISAAQASRQHVSIDLIARRLPPRVRAAALAPAFALACLMMAVIAWTGWFGFQRAWSRGLVMDGIIAWPRWPTYLMVAAGSALLAARLAVEALAQVMRVFGIDPGLAAGDDGATSGHGAPQ